MATTYELMFLHRFCGNSYVLVTTKGGSVAVRIYRNAEGPPQRIDGKNLPQYAALVQQAHAAEMPILNQERLNTKRFREWYSRVRRANQANGLPRPREGADGRVELHPFGYEYEVLYSNVLRLFGFEDRLVLEADHDGDFVVIEDFGKMADYNDPEFQDVMDEQVAVRRFATAGEREQYLDRSYVVHWPWLGDRIDKARQSLRSRESP